MTRRVLTGLFVVYVGLLVWLVMWKLHVPFIGRDDMREIKLVPFLRGGGYGANSPIETLGNLVVFLPFGMFLSALAPGWRWWRAAAAAAALSLAFEIAQYVTAAGSSDVTDVVMNTAGALAGFVTARAVAAPARSIPRRSVERG
jgi:glycopeptide antibiotics resistance protein